MNETGSRLGRRCFVDSRRFGLPIPVIPIWTLESPRVGSDAKCVATPAPVLPALASPTGLLQTTD